MIQCVLSVYVLINSFWLPETRKSINFIANQAGTGLKLILQGALSVFDADELNIYSLRYQNLVIFVIKCSTAAMKPDPKLLVV